MTSGRWLSSVSITNRLLVSVGWGELVGWECISLLRLERLINCQPFWLSG